MSTDAFLQAEEEANRLVEELRRLKTESESYKTAREALSHAATGVGDLSTRCAEIAEQLGGLAGTLRSIGTPELLRGLEAVVEQVDALQRGLEHFRQSILEAHQRDIKRIEVNLDNMRELLHGTPSDLQGMLRADLDAMRQSILEEHQRDLERVKEALGIKLADARVALRVVRNLALTSVGLLISALGGVLWLALMLARS